MQSGLPPCSALADATHCAPARDAAQRSLDRWAARVAHCAKTNVLRRLYLDLPGLSCLGLGDGHVQYAVGVLGLNVLVIDGLGKPDHTAELAGTTFHAVERLPLLFGLFGLAAAD